MTAKKIIKMLTMKIMTKIIIKHSEKITTNKKYRNMRISNL